MCLLLLNWCDRSLLRCLYSVHCLFNFNFITLITYNLITINFAFSTKATKLRSFEKKWNFLNCAAVSFQAPPLLHSYSDSKLSASNVCMWRGMCVCLRVTHTHTFQARFAASVAGATQYNAAFRASMASKGGVACFSAQPTQGRLQVHGGSENISRYTVSLQERRVPTRTKLKKKLRATPARRFALAVDSLNTSRRGSATTRRSATNRRR